VSVSVIQWPAVAAGHREYITGRNVTECRCPVSPLTDKQVLSPDLLPYTIKVFKALKPLNDWLNSILLTRGDA